MSAFAKWTCVFPGKMGLSWKRTWHGTGTKEEAERQASKNRNVVAVPLEMFRKIKEHESRMVLAEGNVMRDHAKLELVIKVLRKLTADPVHNEWPNQRCKFCFGKSGGYADSQSFAHDEDCLVANMNALRFGEDT